MAVRTNVCPVTGALMSVCLQRSSWFRYDWPNGAAPLMLRYKAWQSSMRLAGTVTLRSVRGSGRGTFVIAYLAGTTGAAAVTYFDGFRTLTNRLKL